MIEMIIKTFVQKVIDKYLEKKNKIYVKTLLIVKWKKIKNTIYKMVMECLESSYLYL